jgi:hypothetical protein
MPGSVAPYMSFPSPRRSPTTVACLCLLLVAAIASSSFASTAGVPAAAPTIRQVNQVWFTNPLSLPTLSAATPTLAEKFFNRPDSYEWLGYVPEGWSTSPYVNYGSYAQFKADIDGGTAPAVDLLMYDPEQWWRTPVEEQKRPRFYMREFGQLAHANGYRVVNAPAMNLLTVRGADCVERSGEDLWAAYMRCRFPEHAAKKADGYDIQTQRWECEASLWPSRNPRASPSLVQTYKSRVAAAADQARTANAGIEVYSGLSTGWCAPTGSDLYAAWAAVRDVVAGHFIHMEEPNVLAAVDFFNLVAPVIVGDAAFSPTELITRQGATVTWRIGGGAAMPHSIVDGSGLSLFNSGVHGPGYVFRRRFPGAGAYQVVDGETGHVSLVVLPPLASPPVGDTATSFVVQASTAPAPTGYVYETQIKRPGDTDFVSWKSGYTNSFKADQGLGTYAFRSHLKRKSNGNACEWSPSVSIEVT